MSNGTSEEAKKEEVKTTEPAKEDTLEKKTEAGTTEEAQVETQTKLKRYKEQVAGSQKEAKELKEKIKELESQIPPKKEPSTQLSPQDEAYKSYLKGLGMYSKEDVDKIIEDKTAPFRTRAEAQEKSRQKKIIAEFVKGKPDLSEAKDPEGIRMKKVIARLKRITPADPFDPNASLEEDLGRAYNWAFEKETRQEALEQAKAEGRGEGHEAADTKVGEGASAKSTSPKKTRSAGSEALMKEWGVDDDSINKTEKKD